MKLGTSAVPWVRRAPCAPRSTPGVPNRQEEKDSEPSLPCPQPPPGMWGPPSPSRAHCDVWWPQPCPSLLGSFPSPHPTPCPKICVLTGASWVVPCEAPGGSQGGWHWKPWASLSQPTLLTSSHPKGSLPTWSLRLSAVPGFSICTHLTLPSVGSPPGRPSGAQLGTEAFPVCPEPCASLWSRRQAPSSRRVEATACLPPSSSRTRCWEGIGVISAPCAESASIASLLPRPGPGPPPTASWPLCALPRRGDLHADTRSRFMGRVWGQMWKRSGGSEWTREEACGGGLPANSYSSFPPEPRRRPLGGCCPSTSLSSAKGVSVAAPGLRGLAPGAECCLSTVPRTPENGVGSAGNPLDLGQGRARHRASGNAGLRLASGWTSSRGPAAPAICLHPQLQVGGTSVPGRCYLATLALLGNQMGTVWRGMQEGAAGSCGEACEDLLHPWGGRPGGSAGGPGADRQQRCPRV
nr:uncharacterized protein LOC115850409 [Globicephala melas]XP_060141043.1 uncharacterized protein LOC115850409 [Globicephala melas]XP_060141044.1 uncharacterized protein LOC115850409 [Globicephala melas]